MLLANQGLATPDEWRDNGFLAGWVAHNFLVGNGADAWRKMLDLYNRNSDWDLSVCTLPTQATTLSRVREATSRFPDGPPGTPCQERIPRRRRRRRAGPDRRHQPQLRLQQGQDAQRDRIYRSPRLSELDNILASGYAFIEKNQGRPAADAIGIPYWKAIGQCEGDEACIAGRQSEEIVALGRAGAPVSLPAWVSGAASVPQQEPQRAQAPVKSARGAKPEHAASSGTGFFVAAGGAVVTNAHVVEDCLSIRVTSEQGATSVAKVVARDARNDLALLGTGLTAGKHSGDSGHRSA